MTVGTAEIGLRERKKAATRQALHEAAVRLALAHGLERTTVEAIADEAGVSRRTFSNYFTGKEEALLYAELQRVQALVAMVQARPAEELAWTALTRAAEEFYQQMGELDPAHLTQWRLVRTQPSLVAAQVQTFAALELQLAAEVGARLAGPPDQLSARLTAAAFLAALRVALHVWLDQPAGGRSLWNLVQSALDEAGDGFGDVGPTP
jgi:AcrR family transcriptional regulator